MMLKIFERKLADATDCSQIDWGMCHFFPRFPPSQELVLGPALRITTEIIAFQV